MGQMGEWELGKALEGKTVRAFDMAYSHCFIEFTDGSKVEIDILRHGKYRESDEPCLRLVAR